MTDVLVRSDARDDAGAAAGEGHRKSRIIVVAVDGSDASIQALRWIRAEVLRPGDAIRVLTAFAPPLSAPEVALSVEVIHQSAECARTAAEMAIRIVFGASEPGAAVDHVVGVGNIESLVTRESSGADLIVLGTRPPRGLLDRLKPSATKRITRLASCPVLCVPVDLHSRAGPRSPGPDVAARHRYEPKV